MDDRVLMFILNASWGLVMLFVGFVLKNMSTEIKETRTSVQNLAGAMGAAHLESFKTFVTKDDWDGTRRKVHDLANEVVALKTRAEMIRDGHHD